MAPSIPISGPEVPREPESQRPATVNGSQAAHVWGAPVMTGPPPPPPARLPERRRPASSSPSGDGWLKLPAVAPAPRKSAPRHTSVKKRRLPATPRPTTGASRSKQAVPVRGTLPVPANVPVPQVGWAALKYRWYAWRNTPDPANPQVLRVPKLGAKEQQAYTARLRREAHEAETRARAAYREQLIVRLRFLAALGIHPIMSFCNVKSAGKTSDAIYVASAIAEYTRKFVLVVPATLNTATSTLAMMSGVEGRVITVREFIQYLEQFGAYRALSERAPRNRFGMAALVEDINDVSSVYDKLDVEKFVRMVLTVLPNLDFLILDHGNDNIEEGSITLEATRLSHVLNFVFKAHDDVTRETLRRTIGGYNTDTVPHANRYREMPDVIKDTGIVIPTQEKVRRSIVIANIARMGDRFDYEELTRPEQHAQRDPIPAWEGVGLAVPDDPYVAQTADGRINKCDLQAIGERTHEAILEIAVANLEAAAATQGIELMKAGYLFTPIRRSYDIDRGTSYTV